MTEIIKPTYKFVEPVEGEEVKTPARRVIAKTSTITEHFDVHSTLEYMARMDKEIGELEAKISGLKTMKEAYQKELDLIENELGVMEMDKDFQKEVAEKNQAEVEAKLKEELLKTGNFVEKGIESPYANDETK